MRLQVEIPLEPGIEHGRCRLMLAALREGWLTAGYTSWCAGRQTGIAWIAQNELCMSIGVFHCVLFLCLLCYVRVRHRDISRVQYSKTWSPFDAHTVREHSRQLSCICKTSQSANRRSNSFNTVITFATSISIAVLPSLAGAATGTGRSFPIQPAISSCARSYPGWRERVVYASAHESVILLLGSEVEVG